ncbi:LON peptidase substrate-binding domain-containing protein [soil metagenome]
MTEIGLFPLGLVLLPGEQVPLHIFEERYKELINQCLDTGSEFGIVLLNSRGTRNVGTRAEVVEVLERYDDGQLDIIVEGTDRFNLLEIRSVRTFLTAEIETLVDDAPLPGESEYEACLQEYRRVMQATGVEFDEPSPDQRGLAFQLAVRFQMGVDVKQGLLELRSESTRLDRVKELLVTSAEALRKQAVEKKASTNGKVDHLGPLGPG